jgi:hypothetical protein
MLPYVTGGLPLYTSEPTIEYLQNANAMFKIKARSGRVTPKTPR